MADKAERLWSARVAEIRAAAEDSGALITRYIQQPGLVVDGEVRVNVEFALARFDDGTSVLLLRPGVPEPYVIVEEHLDADSGEVVFYNYDLVEPSHGIYGHHYHGHGGEPTPHRQGIGVPGGHEDQDDRIALEDALWDLQEHAFAFRTGRG